MTHFTINRVLDVMKYGILFRNSYVGGKTKHKQGVDYHKSQDMGTSEVRQGSGRDLGF